MSSQYTTEHAFELGYERGHEVGAAEEANAIAVYVRAEIHRLLTFYGYRGAERVVNALQAIHDGIRNDAHWVNYYNDVERQRLQDLENDTDE